MPKLNWDVVGSRYYEMGVDHGVVYPQDEEGKFTNGEAWNGLVNVTESPSGAEPTDLWADNLKYASMRSAETFGATVEAYTYPDGFAACDGSLEIVPGVQIKQQTRKAFGFSYRTEVHNDTQTETDDGYLLHLVYNATVSPSEKAYGTINDSPEAITFSWEMTTTSVTVPGAKATSIIIIDSRKANADKMKALEDILYGTDSEVARLPMPEEIIELFKGAASDDEEISG